MEIGPIANVHPLPVSQPKGMEIGLPAIFEVEYLGRTDDESYSPGGGKAASGYEEDSVSDDMAGQEPDSIQAAQSGSVNTISYFA